MCAAAGLLLTSCERAALVEPAPWEPCSVNVVRTYTHPIAKSTIEVEQLVGGYRRSGGICTIVL
jgi:hypothetical protein